MFSIKNKNIFKNRLSNLQTKESTQQKNDFGVYRYIKLNIHLKSKLYAKQKILFRFPGNFHGSNSFYNGIRKSN